MGRLTRLTGGTVAASEGGKGKRLGVLVLAGVAVLVLVRLLTRGGDSDDGGIDTVSTEDEGPETVSIGTDEDEESAAEEESEESAAEEESEESDDGSGISVQAIDRRDVDLFDVIAIVGEALRAAREEYERRAA